MSIQGRNYDYIYHCFSQKITFADQEYEKLKNSDLMKIGEYIKIFFERPIGMPI